MKSIRRALLVGIVALAVTGLDPITASAATLEVNTAADPAAGTCDPLPGDCSLREAILAADATTDPDTIVFDIPGSANPVIIDVETSELPTIDQPLTIDGTSDPDSTRVEIHDLDANAGASADGLTINGADITINDLVIRDFSNDGIDLTANATGVRIEGNFIGTNAAGVVDNGNGGNGIDVAGAANTIGGAGIGNLISGNGESGTGSGIRITGAGATANIVQGNFIGTSANGAAPAIANDDHGIVITSSAHTNIIGGTTAASRNVISGNVQDGIRVQGAGVSNTIQGNFIGTDSSGTAALPNAADGVGFRTSASSNIVGGTATGAGNVISGNTDDGIQVGGTPGDTTTIRNRILGNSTFSNGSLGIDLLGVNGVDLNVAGDADTGANNVQNFPVLTSAASSATTTTISGTLNSEASKTYRLEFFANVTCDGTHGEGQTFLGTTSVTTDSSGNVSFTASSLTGGVAGQVATATATDPTNNTSEFSACTTVVVDTTPPVTPDTTPPTTPTTNAGGKFQKQRTFTVTWTTSTDTTGPVRYDVRYREAPYNGGFGGFVNWQSTTTATSATFTGAPGTTYCFSARAIDGAGNASPFGTEGCTNVPVDNPTFKHRGKWAKKTGAGYYLNTFSRTKKKGAKLTLPGVQAKALSVIVTKCKSCGVIKVFFKGKLLKRINLRSKAKARQKLRFVNLNPFTSAQTGTVRITVVSTRKLVIVEGLGVSAL